MQHRSMNTCQTSQHPFHSMNHNSQQQHTNNTDFSSSTQQPHTYQSIKQQHSSVGQSQVKQI